RSANSSSCNCSRPVVALGRKLWQRNKFIGYPRVEPTKQSGARHRERWAKARSRSGRKRFVLDFPAGTAREQGLQRCARAVLKSADCDSPEASELCEHLAILEEPLQEMMDRREFIAWVINPDS